MIKLGFDLRSNSLGTIKNDTNLQNNRYSDNIELQNVKKNVNNLNIEQKNFRLIDNNLQKQKNQSADIAISGKLKPMTSKNESVNSNNLSKLKK